MRVVIIGGGSAGTTCAFELRKRDKEAEITILERTENTEYSPCALPYVISGEIEDFEDIFIFKRDDYEKNNIDLLLNSEVQEIDRENKRIVYSTNAKLEQIEYDKLVLATGSLPFIPPIDGLESADYHVFKTIEDAKRISEVSNTGNAVVIGAGMIGVELAHSLAQRGKDVTLIEKEENILPALLDKKMSQKLKGYLEKQIRIQEGKAIQKVSSDELILDEERIPFDTLCVCTGITPNVTLAQEGGVDTEKGIRGNEFLETNDKDVYACGDCVESTECNSGEKILSALGTTAVRQAQLIAKNILNQKEEFLPVMNTTITKVGEVYVGSVGLSEKRAKKLGMRTISAEYTGAVRAEYYPSKSEITIRIVCDTTGKILGGQLIGEEEVVGRLNLLALTIQKEMHIREVADLETCYNPASAPIFEPLSICAQVCLKKIEVMQRRER